MASAEQIKSLLKSHIVGDDERFLSVTTHVAACEAKLRHGKLAVELRALVDDAKNRRRPRPLDNVSSDRRLRSDGSNPASFLYYLRRKGRSAYEMIRRTVRLVAPFFDDFILEPQALDEDKIRLEWRHRGSDAYFDAASLSDGSLRFIALATLLLQPTRLLPSLIILDEPELGLHPYAITMLCSLVKQTATRAQVILATQSPLLLDHFEPDDVLVTERVNGRSEFNRLNRAELEEWLKDYSLGQLWEKNEIGGRPSLERLERLPLQHET